MDTISLIKSPIATELEEFEQQYAAAIANPNPLLGSVLAYVQQRKGKRMRPVLVFLTAKLLGEVTPSTYRMALALELLHNASLLHDDVIDESTSRRGQPSINAAFTNKIAVLAGDYLFAASSIQAGKVKIPHFIDIYSYVGRYLTEGEFLQLTNVSTPDFSEEAYFEVIRKKTAELFAACTRSAALSVNATDEMAEIARQFGEYVGICFQIKDDIFDYSDSKAIGKPTGNDMTEGKITLPALHVVNTTSDPQAKEIATRVKKGEATPEEITRLIDFTKQHGGIDYATTVMLRYKQRALALLAPLPDTPVKTSLAAYLDYVVERDK